MSNMIPQTPFLNRVIWEHLEQHTRDLVQTQHKKIYVIAGPVYDQNFGYIGPHKDIPVPSKDFKILVVLNSNQTPADITAKTEVISVLMPNVLQDGSMPKPDSKDCLGFNLLGVGTSNDWEKYKTTVGEIESLSGITFGRIHFH